MREPLVSVIMPNYNTPLEYLTEAIDSILKQTYRNFELIIVDDASTDESLDYIEHIEDSRIVVIKNKKNSGQPITRNKALDIAKGKYIAIMDSDDVSYPTRLSEQVRFMEEHSDVIVCGSWFEKFGIENMIRKPCIEDFELYRCQLLFSNTPITLCHSTVMLRKATIDEFHIRYDEDFLKSQDYRLWTICCHYGRIAIIEKVLAKYRTHSNQISMKSFDEQAQCAAEISNRQLRLLGVKDRPETSRWRFSNVKDSKEFFNYIAWLDEIDMGNMEFRRYKTIALSKYLDNMKWNAAKRLPCVELIKVWIQAPNDIKWWLIKKFIYVIKKKMGT